MSFKFNEDDKQVKPPIKGSNSNGLFEGVFKGGITNVTAKRRVGDRKFEEIPIEEADPYSNDVVLELEVTFHGKDKDWTRNVSIWGREQSNYKHPWIKMLEKLNLAADSDPKEMIGLDANFLFYAKKPNAKGHVRSEVWQTFASEDYAYYNDDDTLKDWFIFAMAFNNSKGENKYRKILHPDSMFWTLYYKEHGNPKETNATKTDPDLPF